MSFYVGPLRGGSWGLGTDYSQGPYGTTWDVEILHWFASVSTNRPKRPLDWGFSVCTVAWDTTMDCRFGIDFQFWRWGRTFSFIKRKAGS